MTSSQSLAGVLPGAIIFYLPALLHGGYSYSMIRVVAGDSAFVGQYAARPKTFRLNK